LDELPNKVFSAKALSALGQEGYKISVWIWSFRREKRELDIGLNKIIIYANFYANFKSIPKKQRYKRVEKLKKQFKADKHNWGHLDKYNLTEFMLKTAPTFMIWGCKLNHYDCRFSWSVQQTHSGQCLQLDPKTVIDQITKNKEDNKLTQRRVL